MEGNSIRPSSLDDVAKNQFIDEKLTKRAASIRGMFSAGAQSNNTDNFTTLSISYLKEFRDHPFNVRDDEELAELAESIKANGVLHPIIVRKLEDGFYEILAGHRRTKAAEKAGLQDIPAKVLNVDDDQAVIIMTDTNLKQREKILHSERAKAYKMQMSAYKRQGKRNDLIAFIQENDNLCSNGTQVETSRTNHLCTIGTQVKSRDIVAEMNNTSALQISRYLRLNELLEDLIELVDLGEVPFRAGVSLSYLTEEEQQLVVNSIEEGIIKKIDLKSSEELRELSKDGELNKTVITQMFCKTENSSKTQNAYFALKSATKNALKHFKKTDYEDVHINSDELEQAIVEAIKSFAENRK